MSRSKESLIRSNQDFVAKKRAQIEASEQAPVPEATPDAQSYVKSDTKPDHTERRPDRGQERKHPAKRLEPLGRFEHDRPLYVLRKHWLNAADKNFKILGNRELNTIDNFYAEPDVENRPDPVSPNMFSLSATLALHPDLRDSYCPDWNLDDGQLAHENVTNFASIVRKIATQKFVSWAINHDEAAEMQSDTPVPEMPKAVWPQKIETRRG